MDPHRHQRLSELLVAASRLPVAERERYLVEACGSDTSLIEEVRSLLVHHDAPADRMATGAISLGPALEALAIGTDLAPQLDDGRALASTGRYTIQRILGEGGMGRVYLAEQDRPRRTVALKVMRPGLGDPARLRKRFELEAELLGRLEHPGVARVYDAGTASISTPEGTATLPYFAMEFIDGLPLVAYADEHKLGTRERMRLVARVADAVGAAHRLGIVHRDLKPANVLVDRTGQPKVLDFGVARATDADVAATTVQTDMGQLIGTLGYMSPEQVAGDPSLVGVRSDVYALGAITYELLTGKPLVETKSRSVPEIARVIRDEEATPLSATNRVFRGDLDTIVGKSLEKDPNRRYRDGSDLASDIDRYLNDQPIEARPPTTLYQLGKFARRNRGLVAGIVVAFLALLGGLVGTSIGLVKARDAAIEAKASEARATRRFNEIRSLAKSVIYEIHDAVADLPGSTEARKKLVTEALKYLDSLAPEAIDDPTFQMELSEGYVKVGMAQGYYAKANLGDREGAMQSFRKALEIRERMKAQQPNDIGTTRALGAVRNQIAGILYGKGEAKAALAEYAEVLRGREELLAAAPDDRASQREVAISHQWIGNTQLMLADQAERAGDPAAAATARLAAEASYRRFLSFAERLSAPDDLRSERDLSVAWEKLGDALSAQGKPGESVDAYRESLAVRERLVEHHPDNAELANDLAVSYGKVGNRLMRQKRADEAEPFLRKSLAAMQALCAEDPQNVMATVNLVVGESWMADLGAARGADESLPMEKRLAALDDGIAALDSSLARLKAVDDAGKLDASKRPWFEELGKARDEIRAQRAALAATTKP